MTTMKRTGRRNRTNGANHQNQRQMMTAAALDPGVFSQQTAGATVPERWIDVARKAWEYYQTEPIVSNAINSWRVFALGDEIQVSCQDEDIEKEAMEMFGRLNLNRFVKDMVLQLLVKGDAIGYFNRTNDGTDIEKVTCVNPISVEMKFDNDVLLKAVQKPGLTASGSGSGLGSGLGLGSSSGAGSGSGSGAIVTDQNQKEINLLLDQLIHQKWNATEFCLRGHSMILPAFDSIELLRDYRRAERAIAKRWATPLRFIQVGGYYGDKLIKPTTRMIDDIRQEMNKLDLDSGLVVPFFVKAETYGTDGALDTEGKVKQIKEDILVALGMARSIISGDGPNFATANISMQKMVIGLKEIKQRVRELLDWVFGEWKRLKGYDDAEIKYHFNDLDLHNETDIKKLFVEMYDRGLMSKKTLQTKIGLDPAVEDNGKSQENVILDTNWSVQDIVQLVSLGILTSSEARRMLGLKGDGEIEDEAGATEAIYQQAGNQ